MIPTSRVDRRLLAVRGMTHGLTSSLRPTRRPAGKRPSGGVGSPTVAAGQELLGTAREMAPTWRGAPEHARANEGHGKSMELLGRGWDREPLADVGDALRRGPLGHPPNHTVDARPAVGNDDAPTPEFDAWRRARVQRAVRNLRGLLAGRLVRSTGGEIALGGEMPAAFARAALCSTVRPRLELGSLDPLPQLLPWLGFAVGDLTTGSEAAVALEEVFVADRTGDVTGDPTELAVDLLGARVGRRLSSLWGGRRAGRGPDQSRFLDV